jgi:hypothetical protein
LLGFVESPKESRLPVVASYSVVKEPTFVERAARLPDPSVRVKRNVFSFLNSFRLTRTPVTTRAAGLERSNCSGYCRDRGVYVALAALSSLGGNDLNFRALLPIPASRLCCRRSIAQRSFPVQGPLTTCCLPPLFPLPIAVRSAQIIVRSRVIVAGGSESRLSLGTSRNGSPSVPIPRFRAVLRTSVRCTKCCADVGYRRR